jgi:hypothetical protein
MSTAFSSWGVTPVLSVGGYTMADDLSNHTDVFL